MEQTKINTITKKEDAFVTVSECEHYRECMRKKVDEQKEEFNELLQEVREIKVQIKIFTKIVSIATAILTTVTSGYILSLIV